MAESEVDQFTMSEFPKWLRSYFVENPSIPMKLRGVCPMELQLVLPVQEIHNQWRSFDTEALDPSRRRRI
ncbi:hypothetical protein K1719_000447 [Acacia pycnantha]|nr:hypothetical protein K1719_000447 [Acacia pycnantha]